MCRTFAAISHRHRTIGGRGCGRVDGIKRSKRNKRTKERTNNKMRFVALYCSAENRHSTGSLSWLGYFSWGRSNSFRHLKSWLLRSIDELALVPHHPAVVGVVSALLRGLRANEYCRPQPRTHKPTSQTTSGAPTFTADNDNGSIRAARLAVDTHHLPHDRPGLQQKKHARGA